MKIGNEEIQMNIPECTIRVEVEDKAKGIEKEYALRYDFVSENFKEWIERMYGEINPETISIVLLQAQTKQFGIIIETYGSTEGLNKMYEVVSNVLNNIKDKDEDIVVRVGFNKNELKQLEDLELFN